VFAASLLKLATKFLISDMLAPELRSRRQNIRLWLSASKLFQLQLLNITRMKFVCQVSIMEKRTKIILEISMLLLSLDAWV